MYIEGVIASGKTSKLAERLTELLSSGVKSSEILVIIANSYKKNKFNEKVRENISILECDAFGSLPVFTFNGIVYNSILNNWVSIENAIPDKLGQKEILPELCGLETTEYIMKKCIRDAKSSVENYFKDYFSEINLIHQLFRRYRLVVENYLTDEEVQIKSDLLNDVFAVDSKVVYDKMRRKSLELRTIDYLRQTGIFLNLMESGKINDFNAVKYLLVDDFDELSFACQTFIRCLMPQLNEFYFAGDSQGGSRRGYLCAYPDGWQEFKDEFPSEIVSLTSYSPMYFDSLELFNSVKSRQRADIKNLLAYNYSKRAEMIDNAIVKISELLDVEENKPEDILIITPVWDESTKCALVDFFESKNIKFLFLSGTKNILEDKVVFSCLILAQLINEEWKFKPSVFEIRILLTTLLGIPLNKCQEILDTYKKKRILDKAIFFDFPVFDSSYQDLIKNIEGIQQGEYSLSEQLVEIFSRIVSDYIDEDTCMIAFNSILKSLSSFTIMQEKMGHANFASKWQKEWIVQTKNTVVADTPVSAPVIEKDCVIVATPQKVVDLELASKYQVWLDVSSRLWHKDDIGTLYNTWVFQKNWNKDYKEEYNRDLTLDRTAHVLKKLVLCAREKIFAFYSVFDLLGNENIGELYTFLDSSLLESRNDFKIIVPRPDQKAVLEYSGGRLAVSAVPGAGKTTIMQGLIIELIKKDVKPDEILVLTYMESAARVFLDRIKKNCPGLAVLPAVSTIHSFANRVLRDYSMSQEVDVESDFEICDDIEKNKIFNEIARKHLPFGEDDEPKWIEMNLKALSRAKLSGLTYKDIEEYLKVKQNQYIEEFYPVFKDYTIAMKEKNLIDFDDLLVMALNLLKKSKSAREFYQKQYRFVIEDEAQDSSSVQQELISIVSGYWGNLIRCGDANQAITTTFSEADVAGFRKFIEESNKVEMLSSQRCAKQIYELANHLIDWSKSVGYMENAFLDQQMQPVEGVNSDIPNSLNFKIMQDSQSEKHWVLAQIEKLRIDNPEFTFGVLLRSNPQVLEWTDFLEKSGVRCICFTDKLNQKKVFRFLLKFLEVLDNPWNNRYIYELYEEFANAGLLKKDFDTFDFLKNKIQSPFISWEPKDLPTESLVNFWWNLHCWLDKSAISPEELIVKIGNFYFTNLIDRSNSHIFAAQVRKFRNTFNDNSDNSKSINLPEIVKSFKEFSGKSKFGGAKFFSDTEDIYSDKMFGGFVQVMTVHKSKGNEFDVVFMPEMYESEYSYSITPELITIKNDSVLIEKINEISRKKKKKTEFEIKQQQIEEILRLIYVGITRAENYLFMTSSRKKIGEKYKPRDMMPSCVLEYFISQFEESSGYENEFDALKRI